MLAYSEWESKLLRDLSSSGINITHSSFIISRNILTFSHVDSQFPNIMTHLLKIIYRTCYKQFHVGNGLFLLNNSISTQDKRLTGCDLSISSSYRSRSCVGDCFLLPSGTER